MPRYLVTIAVDPTDPQRTQDIAVSARTAYDAGTQYKQHNPRARIIAIRMAPDNPYTMEMA